MEHRRLQVGFLFKAFETGQARPPRPGTAQGPRAATIHEFLDWTVGGNPPSDHEAWSCYPQDFEGFLLICLRQRYRPAWPSPGAYDAEIPSHSDRRLGASKPPLPFLQVRGKPIVAATIRAGPGYIEVPFFATVEHRKGQGYGRCLTEAIEEVSSRRQRNTPWRGAEIPRRI